MQLQGARKRFEERGLRIASISYDPVSTLRIFGTRQGITYPMLSDGGSATIRAFGMIDPDNTEGNVPTYGARNTSYPGYFLIDPSGVVRERFVDTGWGDRRSGSSLLASLFPELVERSGMPVRAAHLTATTAQTDLEVAPGTRTTLFVDLDLPRGMHVYAPGVEGYEPVSLELAEAPYFQAERAVFPKAEVMKLAAIHETVPVFRGHVRIKQDVVFPVTSALLKMLGTDHAATRRLEIRGTLRYQACSETVCFPPALMPVAWAFDAHPADFERTIGKGGEGAF